MPALPLPSDADRPFLPGVDDFGPAPFESDNALDPTPDNPLDPLRSEGDFRRALLTLLTEIRDALICDDNA